MQTYEVDEDFYEDGVDFGMQAGDQLYTDAENGEPLSFTSPSISPPVRLLGYWVPREVSRD